MSFAWSRLFENSIPLCRLLLAAIQCLLIFDILHAQPNPISDPNSEYIPLRRSYKVPHSFVTSSFCEGMHVGRPVSCSTFRFFVVPNAHRAPRSDGGNWTQGRHVFLLSVAMRGGNDSRHSVSHVFDHSSTLAREQTKQAKFALPTYRPHIVHNGHVGATRQWSKQRMQQTRVWVSIT
jgi:hypothetical protein